MLQGNLTHRLLARSMYCIIIEITVYKFNLLHALGFKHEIVRSYCIVLASGAK